MASRGFLHKHPKCLCLASPSGRQAVRVLAGGLPALALPNSQLPGMSTWLWRSPVPYPPPWQHRPCSAGAETCVVPPTPPALEGTPLPAVTRWTPLGTDHESPSGSAGQGRAMELAPYQQPPRRPHPTPRK